LSPFNKIIFSSKRRGGGNYPPSLSIVFCGGRSIPYTFLPTIEVEISNLLVILFTNLAG